MKKIQLFIDGTKVELSKETIKSINSQLKPELPSKWEDLKEIKGYYINTYSGINEASGFDYTNPYEDRNNYPTKRLAEAGLALTQLLYLREIYNDGWVADWDDDDIKKHCICINCNNIYIDWHYHISAVLNFKTEELRDLFLENFKDLIEIAKPLI